MKIFACTTVLIALALPLRAQTIDDGIMLTARSLQVGSVYTHDQWDEYWEGALKRVNGNIGTVTTQTSTWSVAYGINDRIMAFASAPLVWTRPSQGVLQGQHGMQDMTLGGKYSVLERSPGGHGMLRAIAAVSGALPLTNYVFDFAPMSIGTHSRAVSGRITFNYQTDPGLYVSGTTAYTKRHDLTLDRPYYYTDGQLFLTDQIDMPSVANYSVSVGYLKHDLNTNVSYARQRTQGGGDIRRQDMPFVSNRVIFSRVSAMAMHPIPWVHALSAYGSVARTLDGRNVGQSTTIAAGVLYSYASHGSLIR
jgi:hypothetical protein